jgi:hypothetical protein
LVHECLVAHEALAVLTGSQSISRLRIFTLINEQGEPEIMDAYLRVICGGAITDNISDYSTGRLSSNLLASPDLETGVIQRAWQASPDGVGYEWLEHHPLTGHPVAGFQVPLWDEIRNLVVSAARLFLPIRVAGWDVAITDRGVVLIEVNERFQNASIGLTTESFRAAMEGEFRRLHPVSERVRKRFLEDRI